MSSIDVLSIRGIRSFGPDDAQEIRFAKCVAPHIPFPPIPYRTRPPL